MSLQNFIIKKHTHALDETSKQSLARHLQKPTKAGQTSFAKGVPQQHQIRFLIRANDESKVRRSTTPVVLGKAKVMSYEDPEEARAKHAEKEAAKESKGKGKHGRKRKRATTEPDAPEPKAKAAQMSDAPEPWKVPVARMSEAQVAEDEIAARGMENLQRRSV